MHILQEEVREKNCPDRWKYGTNHEKDLIQLNGLSSGYKGTLKFLKAVLFTMYGPAQGLKLAVIGCILQLYILFWWPWLWMQSLIWCLALLPLGAIDT